MASYSACNLCVLEINKLLIIYSKKYVFFKYFCSCNVALHTYCYIAHWLYYFPELLLEQLKWQCMNVWTIYSVVCIIFPKTETDIPYIMINKCYLSFVCRNPDHQSRPSFTTICHHYFQLPPASILYWAPEDDNLSSSVGVCGAPLYEAYRLHLDLQEKYKNCRKLWI